MNINGELAMTHHLLKCQVCGGTDNEVENFGPVDHLVVGGEVTEGPDCIKHHECPRESLLLEVKRLNAELERVC